MAHVPPYHTSMAGAPPQSWVVYHDDDNCPDGRSIPPEFREPGTGYRTLCARCLMLRWRRPPARRDRRSGSPAGA